MYSTPWVITNMDDLKVNAMTYQYLLMRNANDPDLALTSWFINKTTLQIQFDDSEFDTIDPVQAFTCFKDSDILECVNSDGSQCEYTFIAFAVPSDISGFGFVLSV